MNDRAFIIILICLFNVLCRNTSSKVKSILNRNISSDHIAIDWSYHVIKALNRASDDSISFLCGSSSSIDTNHTAILSYPIDVFHHKSSQFVRPLTFKSISTFNCSSTEQPTKFHRCSNSGEFCPVAIENIVSSLNITQWKLRSNICRLNETEKWKQTPRIIILGGSTTRGKHSQGCCCDMDSTCPSHKASNPCYHYSPIVDDDNVQCGWVDFFRPFISKHFPNVDVINLAIPATTSLYYYLNDIESNSQYSSMKEYGVNSNDLVLIDYSVNDQVELKNDLKMVEFGIEGLVRYFLKLDVGVIILESWPRGHLVTSEADHKNHYVDPKHDDISYTVAYRRVARHYNIPIWSYRNAVMDPYMDKNQINLADYARWKLIPAQLNHPYWYAHLFMADMYAGALLTHLSICKSNLYMQNKSIKDKNTKSYAEFDTIPTALSHHASTLGCSKFARMFEPIDAVIEYKKQLSNESQYFLNRAGSIYEPYIVGWKLYEERKGKPGWIIQANNGLTDRDNIVHIPLNVTNIGFYDGNYKIVIKIAFLRTYQNAGQINIFLCNQSIGIIDSLWPEYQVKKYSVSQIAYISASEFLCKKSELVELKLVHELNNDTTTLKVRGDQKFKLISISYCYDDNNDRPLDNPIHIMYVG